MSIISFQYLFDAYPPAIKPGTFFIILAISLLFIFTAILFKYFFPKMAKDKYQRILYNKLTNLLFTGGLFSLFFILFRKFRVPYFQIRFVLILWSGFLLIWLITIMQYYLNKVPQLRAEDKKRKEYEKYLK